MEATIKTESTTTEPASLTLEWTWRLPNLCIVHHRDNQTKPTLYDERKEKHRQSDAKITPS